MDSQVKQKYICEAGKTRFCQGDILQNVSFHSQISKEKFEVINLAYCVLINQDCDLEQDYNNRQKTDSNKHDKYISQILLLPAYLANELREGKHRSNMNGEPWSSVPFGSIKTNSNPRFHFIEKYDQLQIPELIIDFKHFYSINRDKLYSEIKEIYLASIAELFREDLAQRYCSFLSRVGLPNMAQS